MIEFLCLSKKNFYHHFPHCQKGIFSLCPYGNVEATYTGDILHTLKPSSALSNQPLPKFRQLAVIGTEFQAQVWQALLTIPLGCTKSYSDIAELIGHPKAVRAVGSAIGANPIGILIPCHRVIAKNCGLGGFAWGIELKQTWLKIESTTEHL